jgi:hypothetical protein
MNGGPHKQRSTLSFPMKKYKKTLLWYYRGIIAKYHRVPLIYIRNHKSEYLYLPKERKQNLI